jgi:NADPH-dependent glutamate synthase beta subunit-like oxidoreductase/NAD-dependent dihydropyrimidine dehydrogenase PreA subunit
MGYQVAVLEKQLVPGGMLRLGVPEYRLPRELIRLEINSILSLGVNLQLGKVLGRDFFLKDLRNAGYDAVFIVMGAHKSHVLNIEGIHADGILNAVDYLLNVNLGYRVDIGEKIVVIGGGNVAFDVARSAVRREKPVSLASSDITAALDVARSAVRFGAKKVDMVVLESRHEMLADEIEIEQAVEERITIHNAVGPKRILTRNGKVEGLEIWNVASIFDSEGRFNPQFIPGSERVIEADSIIISIGQLPDLSFIQPEDGIAVTPGGMIEIDRETLATTAKGVYTGGDAAFGPRIAISAIADGRHAARSINTYLSGTGFKQPDVKITCFNTATFQPPLGYTQIPRQPIPNLPLERRVGIAQVELGYNKEQAEQEAIRCLRCWENTIFEGDADSGTECILCGGCADVCPENCIEIVPKKQLSFDSKVEEGIAAEFQIDKETITGKGMVLIKNEEICIRCGLCAKRCPVGTITLQGFEEVVA